jgi:type III secretory pathway component EscR
MWTNAYSCEMLGEFLRDARKERGVTQREMAEKQAVEARAQGKSAAGAQAGAAFYDTDVVAKAAEPFRKFLSDHVSDRERAFFVNTAERLWGKDGEPAVVDPESFAILLPAFCVSELTKAFQIGFLVYLPFIAIDIIVSNILLAMGMMMVSPVTISLPFKLLLFVMFNGWTLLIQGLVKGYMI